MKKHKFNIFPEMQADDYERLKADIAANGYDESMPIMLYQGAIIDGWNRFRACEELRVMPATKQFSGSDAEAIEYIMRSNKRRNLTSSQWACIATEAEEILQAIAEAVEAERRRKQAEAAESRARTGTGTFEPTCDNKLTEVVKPERVTQKAAEIFNTNRTYISEAAKLKEQQPEVFEQVKRGEKTITEVKKEQKKEELKQKKEEYQTKVEEKKQEPKQVDILTTSKKFRVIYADPPWSYNDKQDHPALGGACKHYDTMPLHDICDLPVKNIAEKDSILFLWAVSPLLPEALEVIKAWGFKYKSSFVWDKVGHCMGHYNSVRHEFLLIATRGSCTPDNKKLYDSVQSIEKTAKHSEKPAEFVNIIDDLYTHGDRIELFARSAKKEGWLIWGNEV